MSGHTPGPWEVQVSDWYGNVVRGSNGTRVCLSCSTANARLIAAAPALLEALEGLVTLVDNSRGLDGWHLNDDIAYWDEFEDEVGQANAALASARGEGAKP